MPIVPPGFAHVVMPIRHTALARDAAVTYGVDFPGNITSPSVDNVNAIWSLFYNQLASQFDTDVRIGPATITFGMDSTENLTIEGTSSDVGLNTGASPPAQVAVLAEKLTARGGRRGRGRMYLPWFVTEASVDEAGVITESTRTAKEAALNAWRTDSATANTPLVLLHSLGLSQPGVPNVITSLRVSQLVATQRRRLGR